MSRRGFALGIWKAVQQSQEWRPVKEHRFGEDHKWTPATRHIRKNSRELGELAQSASSERTSFRVS